MDSSDTEIQPNAKLWKKGVQNYHYVERQNIIITTCTEYDNLIDYDLLFRNILLLFQVLFTNNQNPLNRTMSEMHLDLNF